MCMHACSLPNRLPVLALCTGSSHASMYLQACSGYGGAQEMSFEFMLASTGCQLCTACRVQQVLRSLGRGFGTEASLLSRAGCHAWYTNYDCSLALQT